MSKKLINLIILILFLSLSNSFAQEKIAFVDLNFVYSNSKIGKKIIKEIENKRKNINKDFKEFQNKLEDEKEKLVAQKNVLAEDEFKKKLLELENNLKKYNEIINKLRSTLAKYAKDNSISMILRKEQLLIGENRLDVTNDILSLVNKS